ncbi:hypothetical protein HanIR_Chr16g0803281 [Helianthus annuus]|nr:hypothetical protein HanIR_Chr16g0803281 [Helianthus annuus]
MDENLKLTESLLNTKVITEAPHLNPACGILFGRWIRSFNGFGTRVTFPGLHNPTVIMTKL